MLDQRWGLSKYSKGNDYKNSWVTNFANNKQVSVIRKYHKNTLQTDTWNREE